MDFPLEPDSLAQTIGHSVKTMDGKYLGEISSVQRNSAKNKIECLILESNGFLSSGERDFAIPASSTFVKLTGSMNVILLLSKDAMYFTKSIAKEEYMKLNLKDESTVYELT